MRVLGTRSVVQDLRSPEAISVERVDKVSVKGKAKKTIIYKVGPGPAITISSKAKV